MAKSSFLTLLIFFFFFETTTQSLLHQLDQAKLKFAKLELIFEEKNRDLNSVNLYIEEVEKAIYVTDLEIDRITNELFSSKDDLSQAQEKVNALEKEVRRLWEVSRRNNFEIHNLELKANDAQDRWNASMSRVENMVAIISEQWIQVQHLEQAIQMAKLKTLKVKTELILIKCPFLKYIRNAFSHHVQEMKGILSPYLPGKRSPNSFTSQAYYQLSRVFTAAKYFHHQLQGLVKQALKSHDLTAVLANEEVVFFMASALILFPMLGAWVLLSSHYS